MEITLHESTSPDGTRFRTRLVCEDGELAVGSAGELLPLPPGALVAVMKRYGKPLAIGGEDAPAPPDVAALVAGGVPVEESLELGEGYTLVRFRFLRRYDVIARDYLALFRPDGEALCELATAVSAALDHLARRFGC
jgi:hypothetical protein